MIGTLSPPASLDHVSQTKAELKAEIQELRTYLRALSPALDKLLTEREAAEAIAELDRQKFADEIRAHDRATSERCKAEERGRASAEAQRRRRWSFGSPTRIRVLEQPEINQALAGALEKYRVRDPVVFLSYVARSGGTMQHDRMRFVVSSIFGPPAAEVEVGIEDHNAILPGVIDRITVEVRVVAKGRLWTFVAGDDSIAAGQVRSALKREHDPSAELVVIEEQRRGILLERHPLPPYLAGVDLRPAKNVREDLEPVDVG